MIVIFFWQFALSVMQQPSLSLIMLFPYICFDINVETLVSLWLVFAWCAFFLSLEELNYVNIASVNFWWMVSNSKITISFFVCGKYAMNIGSKAVMNQQFGDHLFRCLGVWSYCSAGWHICIPWFKWSVFDSPLCTVQPHILFIFPT